ncbi:MAG: ABC transporter substrate-binding protein, partial [Candidatus Rokuibacteriota bacterium]
MSRSRSGKALIAAVVILAPAISLVGVTAAQPPIRIGASASQTGAYAVPGQERLRGYQLCVKHTNGTGGVLGRKLELVFHDDASDPAAAARVYEELIA